MGFDCGFDIYPRLEATAVNKETYRRFLDEITRTYGDVYDKEGRRADGKVLELSTNPDNSDPAYIRFMVGECPHMPANPERCDYFLRFSSKVSGGLTAPAAPYIRSVCNIAKKYFGSRVHFWHEMCETGDERQWGYYGWGEVRDASTKLRALEAGQKQDPKTEERGETKSTSLDANAPGLGHPCAAKPSQASTSVQDSGSSRSALDQPRASSSLLQTEMKGNVYAIRSIPGKGQGMIATTKIPKGTRIVAEAPLFKVSRVEDDVIARALKGLDKDHQRAFFSLHNAHGRRFSPFVGIARTNLLPLGSEAREAGIFLCACRINHSCRWNAQNTWNENIGRITIHALRDIEEGQEITISYLGRTMKRAERQTVLKEKFNFDCRCDLCVLPPAQRKESDLRQSKIQSIDDAIGKGISNYDAGLHLVRTVLRLFEAEGIWNAGIPRAYYDAYQIAISHGDVVRARIFAERGHAARVVIEGDDSPETARMKQLAARPSQDQAYKFWGISPQQTSPPQETDGPEFEDWLWRENERSKHPATSSATNPWDTFGENLDSNGQSVGGERSENFDSLSTRLLLAALSQSLGKS